MIAYVCEEYWGRSNRGSGEGGVAYSCVVQIGREEKLFIFVKHVAMDFPLAVNFFKDPELAIIFGNGLIRGLCRNLWRSRRIKEGRKLNYFEKKLHEKNKSEKCENQKIKKIFLSRQD